jgi:hypothetical protein
MRRQLERISEPWFMNKVVAVVGAFVMAIVLASLAASGQFEVLILVAVWVAAVLVIVFVRDYWWSPAIIVATSTLTTRAVGFNLTGLEVGLVVICLTFPVKLAMKTLWPAKPKMDPGLFYWALLAYVAIHAVVIFYYSKIEGEPGIQNIVKSYYGVLAPLVLFGLLMRYCNSRTVFPTVAIVFGIWIVTTIISIFVYIFNIQINELTALQLNVEFADAMVSPGFLRQSGPSLFVTAIAFWPVARSNPIRALLGFSGVLGIIATLYGGGRVAMFSCIVAALFFAVVRRRFWLAVPVVVGSVVTIGICTLEPDFIYSLPDTFQRALTPLNFSEQKTEVQSSVVESDRWHEELREDSLTYWNADTNSFFLGHGFKGWDQSLTDPTINDFDGRKLVAIQMGLTENMFSAITNIFGLTGLILYAGLLIQLAWRSWEGRRLAPERSVARAMCEFSFVNLVTCIVLAPLLGGVPGIGLIYWVLGVLAARPYLAAPEPAASVAALPFDRSRQTLSVSSARFRGDPLAEFSKRQARGPFDRKGPAVR